MTAAPEPRTDERTQWHELTIRFGTTGPLDRSQAPIDPERIGAAAGEAVRAVLQSEQTFYVDEAHLFVDQGPSA